MNNGVKSFASHLPYVLAAVLGLSISAVYAQDGEIEEVFVTGSHIKQRSGMNTPVPVTAVASDELNAMAPGNLIEAVSELPQFFENQTPASTSQVEAWFERGGYGNLNMRGLGINRTLTLLNGRRMISSTVFGGIDINVIPEALVRSVESVTGGASAAYGTDAVAGVTNFILDTEFTGFEGSVQGGITTHGDSDNYEGSLAYGTSLLNDRAHLLVSGEIFQQDGVHSYKDRDWYQSWGTVPDANGMLLVRPNVVSNNSTFDGVIFAPGSSLNGMAFDRNANISPFVASTLTTGTIGTPPAHQSITNGGSGDDLAAEVYTIYPDVDRNSLFLYADYDLTENLTVYAQAIRGQNKTWRFNDPRGSLHGTPTGITIYQDNAFLPAAVRQTMINEGTQSFTLRRMGSMEDIGADYYQSDNSIMYSVTGGFNSKIESDGFFDGWSVDGYYQHGENSRKWNQKGLRVDRIHAAADAVDDGTGNIVCRVTLFNNLFPGCVPINLFGRGNASAAAVDYVTGNEPGEQITTPLYFADTGFDLGKTITYTSDEAKVNITDMEQNLFEISANGDIYEGWGAGPVSLAVGGSYRKEEVLQVVHDSTNQSSDHDTGHPVLCDADDPTGGLRGVTADCFNTVGVQYSKVSNIKGSIDVKEIFAETLVPLIANGDVIKQATLNMAARWADYSGSGSIWAYKFGLDAQLTDNFRVRGTYSRDVRAANLAERFAKTGGVANITDPRYNNIPVQVTRFSGGNPNVLPEEADTLTAGFIWQPTFLEGLSLSMDWYQVKMDGAIGQLGEQAVVNRCEEGAMDLCTLITRDPVTDMLFLVGNVYINIDQEKVSGIDLEATYQRDVDWLDWFGNQPESINFRFFGTWLDERSEALAGTAKIDRAGQVGIQQSDGIEYSYPEFKWTLNAGYTNGPFTAFLQERFIGSGTSENALVEGVDIDDNSVSAAFYTDLTLTYNFKLSNDISAQAFGTVTNLFDEDPPVTAYWSLFLGHSQQTNSNLYDLLGRRFNAGLRVSF